MQRLNYQHLYYFWIVIRHGSISGACQQLHLAQPTISAQLAVFEDHVGTRLLRREGRKLVPTDTGRIVFNYAEEIFALGGELLQSLKGNVVGLSMRLNLGITDALPKLVAYRLLEPLFRRPDAVTIHCIEDKTERLLVEIGLHSIDMMLSDMPATPSSGTKLSNHLLSESKIALFAEASLGSRYRNHFPNGLDGAPFILPTTNTALRRSLNQWFDVNDLKPCVKAEIEDSALLKTLGAGGIGLFFSPLIVAEDIQRQYGVEMIGIAEGVQERFYAVTAQRKLKHPLVEALLENG